MEQSHHSSPTTVTYRDPTPIPLRPSSNAIAPLEIDNDDYCIATGDATPCAISSTSGFRRGRGGGGGGDGGNGDSELYLLSRLKNSRSFTLILFTVVVVLLFSDQNLMAPNLSAIAQEFGFNDEEKDRKLGGDIAAAFFGFGAPASLLVGWLTDLVDRRRLFVAIVLLGEMGALSTVFVTSFSQLFWTRAITGVAIGGGIPLVFSVMGDLVGSARRTEASGAIGISIGLGQGLGQVVGGFFGSSTSLGWRFPFLLVSLPCLAATALVLVATRDPPRGRLEQGLQEHFQAGGAYTERPSLKILQMLANSPTVVMVLVQGVPGCIPWGVLSVFLNDFLHKQRGLTVERSTMVIVVFGIGTVIGQVVGAKLGQQLYNRKSSLQPIFMGVSTLAGILPCLMLIVYTGGSFSTYAFFALIGGGLAAITGPNVKSVLMNVSLPSTRGSAFGVFNLFDDLGRGLGPAIVSLLAARMGREEAFTLAMFSWLGCGFILLAMTWTVQRDEKKVQAHLRDYARINSTTDTQPLSLKGSNVGDSSGSNRSASGVGGVDGGVLGSGEDDSKRRFLTSGDRGDARNSSRDWSFFTRSPDQGGVGEEGYSGVSLA